MSLSPPHPDLRVCVVVPARNEEALIASCIEALARQRQVVPREYEVLLVLDRCTDATGDRALEAAARYPCLRLYLLEGPGKGAGHARRTGMEAACARLLALGKPSGLIASTDADTVVAPDWLARQLEAAARGARAIGGRIELPPSGNGPVSKRVALWRSAQGELRHRALLNDPEEAACAEHWQFSGASLALTAETYREVGGLEPRAALEDEHLERVLRQRSIPIARPLSVRVTTSARLDGRARHGLSRDLSLASWFERNTYGRGRADAPARRINASVVAALPPKAPPRLPQELEKLREVVDEFLLLSAGESTASPPGVAALEARRLMPGFGQLRGPGDALWRGLSAVCGEVIVFADPLASDLRGRVKRLLAPLRERTDLQLVCGFYEERGVPEATARALIHLRIPELAGLANPLPTEFAARRTLLTSLPFPVGPAFGLGIVLGTARAAGVDAIAQAFLTESPSRRQVAEEEASYHAAVIICRPDDPEEDVPGPLFVPQRDALEQRRVALEQRPPLATARAKGY